MLDLLTTAGARVLEQAQRALPGRWSVIRTLVDKRATFVCSPALQRPPPRIAEGLCAAGDFVAGPYPGTLESAVVSGLDAAHALSPRGVASLRDAESMQ